MGIIKSILKIKLYLVTFLAGYLTHSCISSDKRYYVKRDQDRVYLVDRSINGSLEIDQTNFQLGSIEYRLLGLLEDQNTNRTLEKLLGGIKNGK